jgi:hypothetical protein
MISVILSEAKDLIARSDIWRVEAAMRSFAALRTTEGAYDERG